MKYQLFLRSIQNIIHLYFACKSKMQHHVFFLSLWKYLWNINGSFQIYPQFVGWITQLFKILDLKQHVLTYLPPIEKPITNYEAIVEMFTDSEQLSKQANTKYTYITLVVGLAIKQFYVLWNQPENSSKVVINLGNIRTVMDFLVQLDHIYLWAHWMKLYIS